MILDDILSHKRAEVETRKAARPLADMKAAASQAGACRGFARALRQSAQGLLRAGEPQQPCLPRLIAEIKGRSPSKGTIREDLAPVQTAQAYQAGGAACVSVLTDERFFGGALSRIPLVREACTLPILEKDFIIEPYQIYEARALGADCILLIAAALTDEELRQFHSLAVDGLGMDALVESHTRGELQRALAIAPTLAGVNNRNLQTFEVSLDTTVQLAPLVPPEMILVGESGIFTREDVEKMGHCGVDAILVGEALVSSPDIEGRVRSLIG